MQTMNPTPIGSHLRAALKNSALALTAAAAFFSAGPSAQAQDHTLTYIAGAGGTITGVTPQTVADGTDGTEVIAEPAAGYHFVNWSDNSSTVAARTDLAVTANITTTANFAININPTLTYSAGPGGTIMGVTPQTVVDRTDGTEVIAVPDSGYHFVNWSDGVLTPTRTDLDVTADITTTATFAIVGALAYDFAATDPVDPVASLQGWTQFYPTEFVGFISVLQPLWSSYDYWWFGPDNGHIGDGWEDRDTQLGRSPEFTLDGSGDLGCQFLGGASPDATPVAPSAITATATFDGGFMGVALRDVATDTYVLSRCLSVNNFAAWSELTFTAAELDALITAAPTAKYTLDFIDYDKNPGVGDGWVILGSASIPGVLSDSDCYITAFTGGGVATGAVINQLAKTIVLTVQHGSTALDVAALAPTFTLYPDNTCNQTSGAIPTTPLSLTASVTYTVTAKNTTTTKDYAVSVVIAPPANDDFANAINLPGTSGTQTGTDNLYATLEVGEPDTVTYPPGTIPPTSTFNNTVWFKWTCPENGDLTVRTLGSTDTTLPTPGEYDAVLGIYSGSAVGALTALGASPQDTGYQEEMTVAVTVGTTYHIQVAGWNSTEAANILLNWTFVPAIRAVIKTFGPGAVINQDTKTISWVLPYGSSLTQAPTYTLSTGSCVPVSNPSPAIDFSDSVAHPVSYVVTDDLIINEYFVTVTVAGPPDELTVSTYLGIDGQTLLDPISNLMAATPTATGTTTAKIDFHGGTWALPGSPTGNNFSVLWDGWFDVTKDGRGVYTFGTSSDDGSMLYLDLNNDGDFADAGELIVSNNNYQGNTSKTGEVDLQVDMVHMVIGFYQGSGGYDMSAAFKKGSGLGFGVLNLINSSSGYFFAVEPAPPPAPTGLVATPLHLGVRLDWTASARATGYDVYRGTEIGTYATEPIGTTTSATTYNDMTAITGGPYFYVVKATNAKGSGDASNEASASPSEGPVNQTITFALGLAVTKTAADAPFADTASAFPSGLTVTYSVTPASPTVATVDASGWVTLTGVPGTAYVVADVAGNADFNAAQAIQTLTVTQATPVITWAPTPILVGTSLSGTQLNASSGGVDGAFVYDPPSGTLMNVVGLQPLSVQFTPTDTVKYSIPALTTVEILVIPVESTVIWNVGSGPWDTTAPNWLGQTSNSTTIFTQGNDVIFNSTAGGTIDIASGMEPASTTVSAASGTYSFSGGPIATGTLTKSGGGSLVLMSPNTYDGGTVIDGGSVIQENLVDGVFGTGPVTLNNGAYVQFSRQNDGAINSTNPWIINSGTFDGGNSFNDWTYGLITLNGQLTIATGGTGGRHLSGIISGDGSILKTGSGDGSLYLEGDNTYSGGTTNQGGFVKLGHTNALGTGTLVMDGDSQGLGAEANLNVGTGVTNNIVLNKDCKIQLWGNWPPVNYDMLLSGTISGPGGITLTGGLSENKTLILSGVNTYTGPTTVTGGTLQCDDDPNALGGGALSISSTGGAKVNLNYTGTKDVASLTLGGVAKTDPGTYGSDASGADFRDDSYFTAGSLGTVTVSASPDCDILTFNANLDGSSASITTLSATEGTVVVTVPYGTTDVQVAALAPSYTLSAFATCPQPNPGVPSPDPLSLITPVHYIVTAQSGAQKDYTVTVTVAPPPPPFTMALTGDGTTGNLMENGEADGYRFQTGSSALTVNWLGLYDAPNGEAGTVGDGLQASHRVSIWLESDGTLVAQMTVLTIDGLEGNFRGRNITPVTLTANTGYVIAADYGGSGDRQWKGANTDEWGVYSGISGLAGRYGGPGGGMPEGEWGVMVGPNFGNTVLGGYGTWASTNGIPGEPASGDFDNDGLSNLMEYALGKNPTVSSQPAGALLDGVITFTKGVDAVANGDVTYSIETSTNLLNEVTPGDGGWAPVTPTVNDDTTISYTLPADAGKVFARLVVTQTP